jgi:hypothetical protein
MHARVDPNHAVPAVLRCTLVNNNENTSRSRSLPRPLVAWRDVRVLAFWLPGRATIKKPGPFPAPGAHPWIAFRQNKGIAAEVQQQLR